MKCNIGNTDKIIRVIAGLAIVGLGLYYKNWLGFLGLIPLITAGLGYCPLYAIIKKDTCGGKGCCGGGGGCCGK